MKTITLAVRLARMRRSAGASIPQATAWAVGLVWRARRGASL
ncbi:MAG: hypothetical protein ACO1PM_08740 [Acidovorax sp.]